jgi:hypothetical protein
METAFLPLLQKYPRPSQAKLASIRAKIGRYSRATTVRISDEALAGIIRSTLGESRANLELAKNIVRSPNASRHLSTIFSLVYTAKLSLLQLRTMSDAVRTLQDWTGATPSAMVSGLGFVLPLWVAGLALVAGIVIFIVGVGVLIDTMQRNQNAAVARENADRACEIAASRGDACTPEDWQRHYEAAARVQNEITPPILTPQAGQDPLSRVGDLVFWGGLLLVGAGVGYAILNLERGRQSYRRLPAY